MSRTRVGKHQYRDSPCATEIEASRAHDRMPRNRIWGCDLLIKTDQHGQPHLALAILDHASRACLRLQRLSDKSSWTLLQELIQAVKRYGRPHVLTDGQRSGVGVAPVPTRASGCWAFASNASSRAVPGKTGGWNDSSARSSGNWQLNRLRTAKHFDAGHCRRFAPGTTMSGHTIIYRDGHPPKSGPGLMCLRRSRARDSGIRGSGVTGEAKRGCPARCVRQSAQSEDGCVIKTGRTAEEIVNR